MEEEAARCACAEEAAAGVREEAKAEANTARARFNASQDHLQVCYVCIYMLYICSLSIYSICIYSICIYSIYIL